MLKQGKNRIKGGENRRRAGCIVLRKLRLKEKTTWRMENGKGLLILIISQNKGWVMVEEGSCVWGSSYGLAARQESEKPLVVAQCLCGARFLLIKYLTNFNIQWHVLGKFSFVMKVFETKEHILSRKGRESGLHTIRKNYKKVWVIGGKSMNQWVIVESLLFLHQVRYKWALVRWSSALGSGKTYAWVAPLCGCGFTWLNTTTFF